MSMRDDEKQNTQSAKVLQLGFNISVSGNPGTDFQIVLDDSGQKAASSTSQKEIGFSSLDILPKKISKAEISKTGPAVDIQEVVPQDDTSVKLKSSEDTSPKTSQKSESSSSKESNIINEIKSTLSHFEKFSEHLKDVPRLKGQPPITSTPLLEKNNSKSESNLVYADYRPRRFSHLYDYHYKKNYYFNKTEKAPDLFLKPLPGENFYRSGFYNRYKAGSLRHYVSESSLNKMSEYTTAHEKSKCDDLTLATPGILKKPDSDIGDKQSISSSESTKDIKIYQSGGILIMQNFKENMDDFQKKEISNFSAKLIENCNRLKDEVNTFQEENLKEMGNFEEAKCSGKVVQFDLSGFENQKLKSGDSSFTVSKNEKLLSKQGSSDSVSDSTKNKDLSPQGTSQSQDFPSLSTVENESTFSNQFGVSPTYSSTKKLEWDSGADVGYYNSDLSKENLSAIEKYVLSHLSSGTYSDSIASVQPDFSKFAQVRIASEKLIDDVREERRKEQQEILILEEKDFCQKRDIEVVDLLEEDPVKSTNAGTSNEVRNSEIDNEVATSEEPRLKKKSVDTIDKSVNVNTLFENTNFSQSHRNVTSQDGKKVDFSNQKLPKVKKFRKSRPSPRKLTWAPQKRRFSLESVNKNYEFPIFEMSNSKKTHKKVVENSKSRDLELSPEVEEIVIDQRCKIKQNVSSSKEIIKPRAELDEKADKTKRPVSGSSSSNNTVLPNPENKETEKKVISDANKFSHQISQTIGLDYESVAVQAFESQKSSICSFRDQNEQGKALEKVNNVQLSSKNIQAYGFNASLPKELAHPKGTNFPDNQYTKGTQFFGGAINSLPNYHSSLITKPGESCSRVSKILNTKKIREAEIIRLNEENKKNILANDFQKRNSRSSNAKNKENLYSKNKKKSHISASQKTKDANSSEKKDVENSESKSKKRLSLSEEADYVHTSDEVSSKVLTSEILKEHGDSIDRNIIQEKYFQSQLIELKKKDMISKSTSIDSKVGGGRTGKECVTVGCQYSSHSRDTTSEEEMKNQVPQDDFIEKSKHKSQRTETPNQYDSSQNLIEEELICTSKSTNQGQITNDSLPSSTQSARSWIPGGQNSERKKSGVGRARSFEYLPGHIYESNRGLREELPNEGEQNLMTSSSSESDSGKDSINKGGKDSEGRNTLILENSTENSRESDQLKILDENLTQLNLIVSKLWEKDAAVKSLNESLFLKFCHKNGSGDYIGNTDTLRTKVLQKKNFVEYGKESRGATLSPHKIEKAKEISIECQTEEISTSDPEKFYHKKKTLEKRISEEKQNQIKWIENEIQHLNILRGLLEKQSVSQYKKSRHSLATETFSGFSENNDHLNSNLNENYSGRVTPVYGCTISLARDLPPAENRPTSEENSFRGQQEHVTASNSDPVLYGMSVSLKNIAVDAIKNLQHVVKLPVGVKISLKSPGSGGERSHSENESERDLKSNQKSHVIATGEYGIPEKKMPCEHDKLFRKEVCTQFPSLQKDSLNLPSTSVQTDFSSEKCNQCRGQKCFCLSLSDRSLPSASRASKVSERRISLKCGYGHEELSAGNKTSSSTDAELLDVENNPNSKSLKPEKLLTMSEFKSGFSENYPKVKCGHKNEYKKCLERGVSKSGGHWIVCQNSSQSNPTSLSEKSDDFSSCHCSKVQIEKFSTCSCHIIKITGAKCSGETKTYQCKKRAVKATENQSCQTDEVTIVTKDLIANPELIKVPRAPNVDCISEGKIAIEKKTTMCQKLSSDQRISFEKRRPYDKKVEVQKKVGVVKRSPEVDVPTREKILQPLQPNRVCEIESEKTEKNTDRTNFQADHTCTCFEAFQKDFAKDYDFVEPFREETFDENDCFETSKETLTGKCDNHPRHYFLKIEETEIDDSTELLETKNSLEVITVKIPVKKAGKGKIYNSERNKSYQINQKSMNSHKKASKGCVCCHACKGYKQKTVECNTSDECGRIPAEKPQSPTKFSVPHPTPVTSSDDTRYQYKNDKYQAYKKRCSPSCSECYCDRSTNSYESAQKRSFQMEYDSHQKYRCNPKSNFSELERLQDRNEKLQREPCCDVKEIWPIDHEKLCQNTLPGTYKDYYNYDRIEYKTKSELVKEEEEKKGKTHQLSLQEHLCRNRPDFYNTAERRRQIITEKARERTIKHNNKIECLMSILRCCDENSQQAGVGKKRIFTTSEMRGQTMKKYKKLPEVTGKIADQKKKEEYRTNRLVADIYSKKLQIETLKGHLNLSNNTSVLATI